jgi:threonine synthase
MTSNKAANICNIAVAGSFDDCQNIVKALFADDQMNARFDLGGVNSINWVRLAIQTVYYFTTAVKLGAPDKAASFVVPTGNFGDVFAGFAAKQMGLPVGRLGVAVNENDIMHRALTTGEYRPAGVKATTSPSMDIQVASNFERLLYEASDRNAAFIQELMTVFSRDEGISLPEIITAYINRDFVSARADESAVADKIRRTLADHGELIDPHTAVGLVADDILRAEGKLSGEVVVLATAHPAKFPDAVEKAAGKRPGLPPRFADLFERDEYMVRAAADVGEVRDLIMGHAG